MSGKYDVWDRLVEGPPALTIRYPLEFTDPPERVRRHGVIMLVLAVVPFGVCTALFLAAGLGTAPRRIGLFTILFGLLTIVFFGAGWWSVVSGARNVAGTHTLMATVVDRATQSWEYLDDAPGTFLAYYLAVSADGDEPVGWRVPEPIYDAAAVGQTVRLERPTSPAKKLTQRDLVQPGRGRSHPDTSPATAGSSWTCPLRRPRDPRPVAVGIGPPSHARGTWRRPEPYVRRCIESEPVSLAPFATSVPE